MQIILEANSKGGILRFNSLVFELVYQLFYKNFHTAPCGCCHLLIFLQIPWCIVMKIRVG